MSRNTQCGNPEYSNAGPEQITVQTSAANKENRRRNERERETSRAVTTSHVEEEIYASVQPGRESRDLFSVHNDIKIQFEDVFAEPTDQIQSMDEAWAISNKAYKGTLYWCYRITSLILGVPAAVCWGVTFACAAFIRIWCCMPLLRCYHTQQTCSRLCCQSVINSFIAPCHEALGWVFYHMRLQIIRQPEQNIQHQDYRNI